MSGTEQRARRGPLNQQGPVSTKGAKAAKEAPVRQAVLPKLDIWARERKQYGHRLDLRLLQKRTHHES